MMIYQLKLKIYNCKLYNGDEPYTLGYVDSSTSYHFRLVCDDGFCFKTQPYFRCGVNKGLFAVNSTNPIECTTARISNRLRDVIEPDDVLYISGSATYKSELLNIHAMDMKTFIDLQNKYYYNPNTKKMYELAPYIKSYYGVHLSLQSDIKAIVYFGQFNTTIPTDLFRRFVTIDCGSIQVNGIFNNSLDYESQYILHMPYIGDVTIEPSLILGKQINLLYDINLLTGNCSALLLANNEIIYQSGNGNLGYTLPNQFKNSYFNSDGLSDSITSEQNKIPFIRIISPNKYGNEPQRVLDNRIWVQINSVSGFASFEDVELKPINRINKYETNEIISLLHDGIII